MNGEEMIDCVCPRCGKQHQRQVFWTGKGAPRIYCRPCEQYVSGKHFDAQSKPSSSGPRLF